MSLFSSRWFKIVAVITTLCVALLVTTPMAIQYLARQWLIDNGGQQVRIRDVDFNPFTAVLRLEDLEIQVESEKTLLFESAAVDLAWRPLLRKQVDIQAITLTGFHMIVDDRPEDMMLLGGIRLPAAQSNTASPPEPGSSWSSGIQSLTLNDFHLGYVDQKLEIDINVETLQLNRFSQWAPQQAADLLASGTINDAPFELDARLSPLASPARYEGRLAIQKLPVNMFEALASPGLTALSGLLSYDGEFALSQAEDGIVFSENGRISVASLDVSVASPAIDIHNRDMAMTGSVDFQGTDSGQKIELESNLEFSELHAVARDSRIELAGADSLNLNKLRIQGLEDISIEQISSTQLKLGRRTDNEEADQFLDMDALEVSGFSFADKLLSMERVHYTNARNRISRDEQGNWQIIGLLNAMSRLVEPPEASAATDGQTENSVVATTDDDTKSGVDPVAEQAEDKPLDIVVKEIRISGDSTLSFSDLAAKPPFSTVVHFEEISVSNVDTRTPEQPSPVKLEAGIGKHTRISLSGNIQPFMQPVGLDLSGKIHAMDLPPLSSYTGEALGLALDSGTLDMDLKLTSTRDMLEGKAVAKLHQLELADVDSKKGLQSKMPVPINVALNTLRDKHNTIELEVPIKGDPENPDFDISDAINQALAKGVRAGAVSYLKFALQPYGTIITAAQLAGEAITRVRLNPVEFAPGQSVPDETGLDYLSKVAKVMTERPQLAVKLCGVAVQQDLVYFQQLEAEKLAAAKKKSDPKKEPPAPPVIDKLILETLAKQRAEAVKDHLVEKYSIAADHLVGCRPRLETDDAEAAPRADLLL